MAKRADLRNCFSLLLLLLLFYVGLSLLSAEVGVIVPVPFSYSIFFFFFHMGPPTSLSICLFVCLSKSAATFQTDFSLSLSLSIRQYSRTDLLHPTVAASTTITSVINFYLLDLTIEERASGGHTCLSVCPPSRYERTIAVCHC